MKTKLLLGLALVLSGCASTRPPLTLAHNIQIPKEWSAGSENPGMPDCGTAERYVSAYDRGWWIMVQNFATDINFDDPSPFVMSGWAEEAAGAQAGYATARDRIKELIRIYGKPRVSEYLRQFKLPDEAIFLPWGWEDAADAKAHLNAYKHVLIARVDTQNVEDKGSNQLTPLHFKATVVKSYKGDWQPSEKISFVHYVDTPAPAVSVNQDPTNRLIFIFTSEHTNAEIELDTGEWGHYRDELAPALEYLYPEKKR